MRGVLLAALLLVGVALATSNVCRDNAVCCAMFEFQRGSSPDGGEFGAAEVWPVESGVDGPWSGQGMLWSVLETSTLTQQPYPLGLLNLSWSSPSTVGAAHLGGAASERMVLAAFEYYSTTLLRRTSTLVAQLAHQPACVASVRTVRALEFNYRESVTVSTWRTDALSGTSTMQEQKSALWTTADQLPGVSPLNTFEFNALHVDELRVAFTGQGYGAVAAVEVCYSAPYGVDNCGVCGGDNSGCDTPGASCNTGMPAPCASGTLDAQLHCVSNLAGQPELCNGLDDNCDGLIDNADFGVVECGVGACHRSYSQCINGEPNARCVPGVPSAEVCNGVDDDCDGTVDNGGVCPSPSSTPPPATPSSTTSASATPTPSHSATPSPAPLVDRPAVLVPLARCVRRTETPGVWQAEFGYAYTGATDLSVPVHPSRNWLSSAHDDNQPQPTLFRAQTQFAAALQVLFTADTSVQWRLAAPGLNASVATLSASSTRCADDSDSVAPTFTYEPVAPHFDGCVRRLGDQCFARLAYVNPNAQSVELPATPGVNWFSPGPADRRQPRVFWPGVYAVDAQEISIDCAQAHSWSLNWTLVTRGVPRVASIDSRNEC